MQGPGFKPRPLAKKKHHKMEKKIKKKIGECYNLCRHGNETHTLGYLSETKLNLTGFPRLAL